MAKPPKEDSMMAEMEEEGEDIEESSSLGMRFTVENMDCLPSDLKVGDTFTFTARAVVTDIADESNVDDESEQYVDVDFEDVSCEMEDDKMPEEMTMKEYKKMRDRSKGRRNGVLAIMIK